MAVVGLRKPVLVRSAAGFPDETFMVERGS
jgi:hypothetical protein